MKIGRLVLFLCCLILMGTMTACGEKAVSENQILYDIRTYREFAPLNVEVTDWEIIKRQTNYEDKTDYVYCITYGKNDDYSVVRNYKLKYVLYNDGWILEEIENYQNPDAPTETIPLHGVSHNQVMEDLSEIDFLPFSSFDNVLSFDILNSDAKQSGSSYFDINNFGRCVCRTYVEYTTPVYFEEVIVPIEYFFTQQDDGSFGWNYQITYKEMERSLKLKAEAFGKYVLNESWASGEVEISSSEAEYIYVRYSKTGIGSMSGEGMSQFSWYIDEESGKIRNPQIKLPDSTYWKIILYDGYEIRLVGTGGSGWSYYRE